MKIIWITKMSWKHTWMLIVNHHCIESINTVLKLCLNFNIKPKDDTVLVFSSILTIRKHFRRYWDNEKLIWRMEIVSALLCEYALRNINVWNGVHPITMIILDRSIFEWFLFLLSYFLCFLSFLFPITTFLYCSNFWICINFIKTRQYSLKIPYSTQLLRYLNGSYF